MLSLLLSARNKSSGSRKAGLAFWYRGVVEFGAHLPLMDFGGHPFTLDHLLRYARTAEQLGFDTLCANDHLVFAVPWLDGPTALAAVIEASGQMTLATTVALVAVRGPVPVAKALAAIDRLRAAACWSRRARVPPLAITTVSASSSGNGGHAWTRRSAPCVCCGAKPGAVHRAVLLH